MKTVINGNVATAPAVKTNAKGQQYVSFSICEDILKKEKESDSFRRTGRRFYTVTVYVKDIMDLAMTFVKGERVEISGRYNSLLRNGMPTPVRFLTMTGGRSVFKPKAKEKAAETQAA